MTMTNELVDAKIGAASARTDTKFEQLLSRIDTVGQQAQSQFTLMNQRLNHMESQNDKLWSAIWTATSISIGTMVAIVALMFTAVPWALDHGADMQKVIHAEVAQEVAVTLSARTQRAK